MSTAAESLDVLAASPQRKGGEQMKTHIVSSIVLAVLITVAAQVASAATITVNTTAGNVTGGDAQCTLREAIANVNAAADTTSGDCVAGTGAGDTVTFNLTLTAKITKITLTLGELVIGRDVSIMGPTPASCLYSGPKVVPCLHVSGVRTSRVFNISAGATATVSDLTIEKGRSGTGGAVYNNGNLALTNCTLQKNVGKTRYGMSPGGAIYNDGNLTLTNCLIRQNRAGDGGGIYNWRGRTLTATNTTFKANTGSAIANNGIGTPAAATLTNCALIKNRSLNYSGGIQNDSGNVTLTNCTLAGNRGNAGGAIQNIGGTLTLTNCTLQGNKAIPGTRRGLGGGGIHHESVADPRDPPGAASLINTIVAGSGTSGNCSGDPITSNGHNLSSDGTCFTSGGTDLVNTDPMLAPLANYGGPTGTFALCSGAKVPSPWCAGASPAIDAGDDVVTGPPLNLTTDQRGLPRLSGAHVDIGAYEAQP
jgi:hypothetical protein